MDDSQGKQNLVDLKSKIAENQQKAKASQDLRKAESLIIPPSAIINFVSLPTESGEKQLPRPLNNIVDNIREIKDVIKISDTYYLKKPEKIQALPDYEDLFSALQEAGKFVFFKTAMGFTSKKEVYSALLRRDADFDRLSSNPSYPKDGRIYYDCEYIEPLETGAVDELVAFFYPKTDYDKALIKALIVTPAWSQGAGKKPLFIIQSDPEIEGEKVNVGKTTLARIVSTLYGGSIDLKPGMSEEKSAQAMVKLADKQVVIYDNVKTTAWSSAQLEAMVTANTIQGHALYKGAVIIPNDFTYIVTVNDPSVSPDLASRAVPISLCKPPIQDATWQYNVEKFLQENRTRLFQDIGHIISREHVQKEPATRFPVWEEVVLNKLINEDLKSHIKLAQQQVNFESETGWQDFLIDQLSEYSVGYLHIEKLSDRYNPDELNWFISSSIVQRLYLQFAGTKNARMGTGLARKVKSEMKRLTNWNVQDTRVRVDKGAQMRGYLLTVIGKQSPQKYYSPIDIPDRERCLKTVLI